MHSRIRKVGVCLSQETRGKGFPHSRLAPFPDCTTIEPEGTYYLFRKELSSSK